MKIRTLILPLSVLIFFFACTGGKNTTTDGRTKEENGESSKEMGEKPASQQDTLPPLIIQKGYEPPKEQDPYTIEEVFMKGNILTMNVSYSGGCEPHDFQLYAHGNFTEGKVPGMMLYLEHDAHGDACRALKHQTLKFDVSDLEYPGAEKIQLNFWESDHELMYYK